AYGLAIGAVPSKKVPEVVNALTEAYTAGRQGDEKFREWVERIGKRQVKALIDPFTAVPPYDVDPSYYTDWGDPREYTIGDIGVGECAGEVISFVELGLSAAEREIFEAQLSLDEGDAKKAAELAYRSMVAAARALARETNTTLSEEAHEID